MVGGGVFSPLDRGTCTSRYAIVCKAIYIIAVKVKSSICENREHEYKMIDLTWLNLTCWLT